MRLYLFGIILSILSFNSFGQFSKNSVFLNGFGSFSFERNSNPNEVGKNSTKNFILGTSPGYFVVDNLVVGGTINWSNINQQMSNAFSANNTYPVTLISDEVSSKEWALGPFIRFYFFKGLYVEGGYGLGKSKITEEMKSITLTAPGNVGSSSYSTVKKGSKSNVVALGVGYSLIVNKSRNLGVDMGCFYRHNDQGAITYNGLSINLALLGFISLK